VPSRKLVGAGILFASLALKALNAVAGLDFIRTKAPGAYRYIASPPVLYALALMGFSLLLADFYQKRPVRKTRVTGTGNTNQTTSGHSSPAIIAPSGPVTINYHPGPSTMAAAIPVLQHSGVHERKLEILPKLLRHLTDVQMWFEGMTRRYVRPNEITPEECIPRVDGALKTAHEAFVDGRLFIPPSLVC
jgi:hypothetical protein